MKILLLGEYSRLHNSLKEGLLKNGHEVLLVSTGDGFKNYPTDINIGSKIIKKPYLHFIAKGLYRISKIDLVQLENAFRFYKILPRLKNYDVVQLINERSVQTYPFIEVWFLKKLLKQNDKLFLLSCGTDYISVKFANEKKLKYSILTPFHNNLKLKKHFKYALIYLTKPYLKLHRFLYKNINGVIASDIDYHIPLKNHPKYLGLIPNPINIGKTEYIPTNLPEKIIIFHGTNSLNYIKKGNLFFDEALKIIQNKYPEKVTVITTKDFPYKDYIKLYDGCHILLDQVYAYDQGYNALEAMAKGKVVFTGAEQEWLEHYNLEIDSVAINALPDTADIVEKLEWLILNPIKINEISKNARAFIEKEHDYKNIAVRYLKTWRAN